MKRRTLVVLAVLLGAVLAFTGVVSARRVGRQLAVGRACSAVAEGRYDAALAESAGLTGADDEGRVAAECRCRALEASGRRGECVALLEALLEEPGAVSWLPPSDLAARVVRARLEAGDLDSAADLARRSAAVSPADAAIHQLEVVTRGALEGETVVLEDLERRLAASAAPALGLRLALAVSYSRRNDPGRVVAALGEEPPPQGHPFTTFWFQARCWAIAQLGDLARLRDTYDAWKGAGGDPYAMEADYALQLSVAQLRDPERSWVELIAGALEHESELRDPKVPAALYVRWIGHLLVEEEFDEALRLHDRAAARYTLVGITREQIVQGRTVADLGAEAAAAAVGELVFRLAEGAPSGVLWLSPDVGAEPDADYAAYPLAAGAEVRAVRGMGATPQRWVFRDSLGRTAASGGVWPVAAGESAIRIEASPGVEPLEFAQDSRAADGRRRVFVVVPDCGDWRLVQYLRTRGELPVMDALLARGHRAVLASDPPLTAAAMEKLVWPERGRDVSFLGELNRLGLELAGLASVGRNPLGSSRRSCRKARACSRRSARARA